MSDSLDYLQSLLGDTESEPTAKDNLQILEESTQPETGFLEGVWESFKRGPKQAALDQLRAGQLEGRVDKDIVDRMERTLREEELADPISTDSWLKRSFFGAANSLGAMLGTSSPITAADVGQFESADSGLEGAFDVASDKVKKLLGFGGAAIAPSAQGVFYQGKGEIAGEALKNGADPQVANMIGDAGGLMYTSLEAAQIGTMLPGTGLLAKQLAKKTLVNSAIKGIAKYGANVTEQTIQEGLQKATTDTSVALTQLMDDQLSMSDMPEQSKQILNNAWKEMVNALGPSMIMTLPGSAIDAMSPEAMPNLNEKVDKFNAVVEELSQETPTKIDFPVNLQEELQNEGLNETEAKSSVFVAQEVAERTQQDVNDLVKKEDEATKLSKEDAEEGDFYGSEPEVEEIPAQTVYHGGEWKAGTSITGLGLHVAQDEATAKDFADTSSSVVSPVELRAGKYLRITDHKGSHTDARQVIKQLIEDGILPTKWAEGLDERLLARGGEKDTKIFHENNVKELGRVRAELQRQGYDGLVYKNTLEGKGKDSYVVFDLGQKGTPNQASSLREKISTLGKQLSSSFKIPDVEEFLTQVVDVFTQSFVDEKTQQKLGSKEEMRSLFTNFLRTGRVNKQKLDIDTKAGNQTIRGIFTEFQDWMMALRDFTEIQKIPVDPTIKDFLSKDIYGSRIIRATSKLADPNLLSLVTDYDSAIKKENEYETEKYSTREIIERARAEHGLSEQDLDNLLVEYEGYREELETEANQKVHSEKRALEAAELSDRLQARAAVDPYSFGKRFAEALGDLQRRQEAKQSKANQREFKRATLAYAKEFLTHYDKNRIAYLVSKAKTKNDLGAIITELRDLQTEYEKLSFIRKFKKFARGIDLKRLTPEYRDEIRSLVKLFDFSHNSRIGLSKEGLAMLDVLFDKELKEQLKPEELKEIQKAVGSLEGADPKNLSLDYLRMAAEKMRYLVKWNDTLQQQRIQDKMETFQKDAVRIQSHLSWKEPESESSKKTLRDVLGTAKDKYNLEVIAPEYIIRDIDNMRQGPVYKALYERIDQGQTKELRLKQTIQDTFRTHTKGINMSKWSKDQKSFKLDNGRTVEMSTFDRISLFLLLKRQRANEHIREGGIKTDNLRTSTRVTEADLDKLSALNPLEEKVANTIHFLMNGPLKNAINEASIRLNGYPLTDETNYFSMHVERTHSPGSTIMQEEKLAQNTAAFARDLIEEASFLKPVTGSKAPLNIHNALDVLFMHTEGVAKYYGLAEPLRYANDMLDTIKKDLDIRFGPDYYKKLKSYLRDVEAPPAWQGYRWLKAAAQKTQRAVLAMNPVTALNMIWGYLYGTVEMNNQYLTKAVSGKLTDIEEIKKWSPQLRNRFEGFLTREMGETFARHGAKGAFLGKKDIFDKTMAAIQYCDALVVRGFWDASKAEIKANNPMINEEDLMEATARRTEEMVRLTQGTYLMKDRSSVARSNDAAVYLFQQFHTQSARVYMMLRQTAHDFKMGRKAKALQNFAILTMVVPTLMSITRLARDAAIEGSDEDKRATQKELSLLQKILFRNAQDLSGMFYGVDLLLTGVLRQLEGRTTVASIDSPLLNKAELILRGVANAIQGAQAEKGDYFKSGKNIYRDKSDVYYIKALDQLADGISSITLGVPYSPTKGMIRTIKGLGDKL